MIGTRLDYSFSECALSFWATLTLTVLAVTSLVLRYVTNPLSCNIPAHFVGSHVDFALQTCFLSNRLYPLPAEDPDKPYNSADGEDLPPPFYTNHQWLPFFLGVAATLCLLPHVAWSMLRSFLWMDAHGLAATLTDNLSGGGGGQSRGAASARHVMLRDCALLLRAGLKGGNSVLSKAVILRKTLACLMCLIQMFLMLLVFAPQVGVGGGQGDGAGEGGGYAAVVNANNESVSVPLPVHTFLCRFIVRTRGRDDPFTCSCIMPLAQVYTKALVFLVYLFLVLFLLSALDLTLCAMRLAVPRLKDATLRRFLSLAASQSAGSSASPAHLSAFLDSLGVDGRWLLAVVADCCGVVTAADLTSHLWQAFLESPPKPDQASSVGVPSPAESSGAAARGTRIAEESGGDAAAVPMVTISLQPGDTVASKEEKGGI